MLSIVSQASYFPDLGSVLDRHDPSVNYTPPHYPDWTDKEWKAVYREHIDQLQTRWIRGAVVQHIQSAKKKKIIILLEVLCGPVYTEIADRAQQLHQSTQENLKMKAILRGGDRSKITQQALDNEGALKKIISKDPNGKNLGIYLLWATRLIRSKEIGKGRKYNQQMISLLEKLLQEVEIDTSMGSIETYIKSLPKETRLALAKEISESVSLSTR